MPLYSFDCSCGKNFSKIVTAGKTCSDCPDCGVSVTKTMTREVLVSSSTSEGRKIGKHFGAKNKNLKNRWDIRS